MYFSVLLLITLGNYAVLVSVEDHVKEHRQWVSHTNDIINTAQQFIGHMTDSETGQRGFLLTLNPDYLEPYHDGLNKAKAALSKLLDLTKDNEVQQITLGELSRLKDEKALELNQTITLAKQDKISDALMIVNSGAGKRSMDKIRLKIKEFLEEEDRLLTLRTDAYVKHKDKLNNLFILEALVLASLIVLTASLVQRHIVKPLNIMKNAISNNSDIKDIHTIADRYSDEIGFLAKAFIKMDKDIKLRNEEKDTLISDLEQALTEIKTLKGIIPICSHCKKIRDDQGYWNSIERYLSEHSEAELSHGLCQKCAKKHYPEYDIYEE